MHTTHTSAFAGPAPLPPRRGPPPQASRCASRRPAHATPRAASDQASQSAARAPAAPDAPAQAPPAGLSGAAGATGTTVANLFPIPLLGAYGWFLTVYKRDLAARTGPFVARFGGGDGGAVDLFFRPGQRRLRAPSGDSFRAFKGVAAGNLNVCAALDALDGSARAHEVRLFERGKSEFFFNRRVEVHLADAEDAVPDAAPPSPVWADGAPTFRVTQRRPFELRDVFPGGGAAARAPARLEYFAISLFPIPVLKDYAAFVAVWRQRRDTTAVAVDRVGARMRVGPFDPLELPDGTPPPGKPAARFAVATFFGGVTDEVVAVQVERLTAAVRDAGAGVVADDRFRVVVDSSPNTVTPNRRNELWIEVQ